MLDSSRPQGTDWSALVSQIRKKLSGSPGRPSESGPPQPAMYSCVSEDELNAEEGRLGFTLPTLLRLLYTRVANGGFGPGAGLLCLRQISPRVDQTIPTIYRQLRESRTKRGRQWQEGLVPFAQWGDFILSCVDLSSPNRDDPPVVRFEPNMPEAATYAYLKGEPFRGPGLIPERDRLSSWFTDWIEDREMFRRPYATPDKA